MGTREKLQFYSRFKGKNITLLSSFKSAITTCGVGEIASVEEHFGFLWGHGNSTSARTPEQQEMFEIWSQCRDEMLDKMNHQLRYITKFLEDLP